MIYILLKKNTMALLLAGGALLYMIFQNENSSNENYSNFLAIQKGPKEVLDYPVDFSRRPLELYGNPGDWIYEPSMQWKADGVIPAEQSFTDKGVFGLDAVNYLHTNRIYKIYRPEALL